MLMLVYKEDADIANDFVSVNSSTVILKFGPFFDLR